MSAQSNDWMEEWMTEWGSNVRYALCSSQRCRPASRQQESHGTCLIIMESITKQKLVSGRKIVGSGTESLISILYCPSLWAVHWSPPTQKWRMGQKCTRGCRETDGGCGKSGKTASQRQARCCWGWGWEGGSLWNQTVWGNWVQVHWQTIVCLMMWWRQISELSTPSCLGLPVTAGKHWRIFSKHSRAKWWTRTKQSDPSPAVITSFQARVICSSGHLYSPENTLH